MSEAGIYYVLSGVAVGVSIAIAVIVVVVLFKRRSRSSCKQRSLASDPELQQLGLSVRTTSDKVSFEGSQCPLTSGHATDATPPKTLVQIFTNEELRKATEDFGRSNHIEGSVYHGRLGGNDLAVKQIQSEDFSKIDFGLFHDVSHKHPNIIKLLGTCLSSDEASMSSYLVFEYAKNGSLRDWLHGGLAIKSQFIASCYCFLAWNQRLRICLDIAMALQYMHHIMNPSYVHRNIRSRNIFLDEEFNAKIGNFGMASCGKEENDNRYTAYLAPEYTEKGSISPGLDVFAYGVVLLEILSGRPPKWQLDASENCSVKKIKGILQSDDMVKLRGWMDSALGEDYSFDAAVAIANLAISCTEEDPSMRPTAGDIVERLLRLAEDVPNDHDSMMESSLKPLVQSAATQPAVS